MKVYEYSRAAMGSTGICVYDCCYDIGVDYGNCATSEYKRGTTDISGGCNEQSIQLTKGGKVFEVST